MAYQHYVPVKCSSKECSYPSRSCRGCLCNATERGRSAQVNKDPKGQYKFARLLFHRQPY